MWRSVSLEHMVHVTARPIRSARGQPVLGEDAVWSLLSSTLGVLPMVEIQFGPTVRPAALAVNVPRPMADEDQPSAGSDEHYLQRHLQLTRERILGLQGAFDGLQELPSASQASDDRRGAIGSRADLDFHARLITGSKERDVSEAERRGLSVNLLV